MAKELINHPNHYQGDGGMETIQAMIGTFGMQRVADWCLITAFKYISRMGKKDSEEQEADKAIWYLRKYKQLIRTIHGKEEDI